MTWSRGSGSGSPSTEPVEPVEPIEEPTTTRRVGRTGKISFAAVSYPVGVWLDGETVEVSVANGLVSIHHRGVLVATHAQRHRPAKEQPALARKVNAKRPRPRQATVGQSVTRKVDSSGNVSASPGRTTASGELTSAARCRSRSSATPWRSPPAARSSRSHPIRHDRSREHGAFANAGGRPSRINAA